MFGQMLKLSSFICNFFEKLLLFNHVYIILNELSHKLICLKACIVILHLYGNTPTNLEQYLKKDIDTIKR